ncbi:DUF1566 domain-containing protein [Uliginosibacterium sp. 31-12]|uniref:Lcl C-terminal domain-containing protein n=1 Tax=Uliginosibacterium sp. 31-12 TaxID=3062781 RepID=UPI0026E1B550|nr:DUF1566 domain-containing protein [Uliginosibacterium sp. 31-12]MDO6384997.1 DUF1566 domain-containing protein [Uliginosibacterium sp. 31-12]
MHGKLWTILVGLVVLAGCASAPPADRFVASADGQEVTDTHYKLVWRRCVEGMVWDGKTCSGSALEFAYPDALSRARVEAGAGAKAWRIPTVQQLGHLADRRFSKPAIDSSMFPATPTKWFWTDSDLHPADYDPFQPQDIWVVDFASGRSGMTKSDDRLPLRLVRVIK